MALKKTLMEKLFNISKGSSQALTNCRISSSTVQNRNSHKAGKASTAMAPDPGDNNGNVKGNGMFRRFLHKGAMLPLAMRKLPMGENLMERLREMDISKDRIRLDGLIPHLEAKSAVPEVTALSVQEAKKLLRVAQLEMVKTRLRDTGKNWISSSDFIRLCKESCSDSEQGLQFAKVLDESGIVIALGNVVILRPEQDFFDRSLKTCKRFPCLRWFLRTEGPKKSPLMFLQCGYKITKFSIFQSSLGAQGVWPWRIWDLSQSPMAFTPPFY